jgi:hypothetical protein
MSNKKYPYLAEKKKYKTDKLCSECKKFKPGFTFTWEVSWFRGDDEVINLCDECAAIEMAKESKRQKAQATNDARKAEKEARFWQDMKKRIEEKYTVKYLTEYQWRINGTIDLYVVNRRYHDLKSNKRGSYQDMFSFLATQLAST